MKSNRLKATKVDPRIWRSRKKDLDDFLKEKK
ncbi:MAG: hypothetical protein HEQ35_16745 [Gloeotrichia echinulata IR180]|nr:hypothetical protein [Gloeotrichia echinulata DEX184]